MQRHLTSRSRREEAAVRRLATQIYGPHTRKRRFQLCHFSVAPRKLLKGVRVGYSHLERENETPFTRENETTYLK